MAEALTKKTAPAATGANQNHTNNIARVAPDANQRITASELATRLAAKRNGNGWMARCPAHEDRTPSLHISERQDGSVGIHCHAGCEFLKVLSALKIAPWQLFPPRPEDGDPIGSLAVARGWTRKALELMGVRPSDNGLEALFPMQNAAGDIIGYRRRRGDGQKFKGGTKALSTQGSRNGLMKSESSQFGPDLLAESEADAVAILSEDPGASVIATPGATPGRKCLSYLPDVVGDGTDIILLPHPDDAGNKWSTSITKVLEGKRLSIVPAVEGRDIDDRLKSGESLEAILSTAERVVPPNDADDETDDDETDIDPEKMVDLSDRWLTIVNDIARIVKPSQEIFFHREIVRIRLSEETDALEFEPLTAIRACSELERFCDFCKVNPKTEKVERQRLTEGMARPIVSAPEFARKLPKIRRLADYPMPIKIGNKIQLLSSGYDPETGTFTDQAGPTPESMRLDDALKLLKELLDGFCFAEIDGDGGAHYRLNALAYLLTCHCRFLIEPERTPIFYAGGNRPGVGKDYLLGLGPLLATGRAPDFHPPTKDSEETRKRILAVCRAGRRFMIISNVRGHLADEALEQAATSIQHTDRVLGRSEELTFPNLAIYALSGNQLTYSEDFARRMCPIELEFFGEDIQERSFKHSDLYSHALKNREKYLGALQSMIEAWIKSGCPAGGKEKASFVKWSQTIGGIFESCGVPNPINEDPTTATPNEEAEHFGKLLKAVHDKHGSSSLAAKELQEAAVAHELFTWLGDLENEKRAQIRFGLVLKKMQKRRFAGLFAVADRTTSRVRWQVKGNQ